MARVVIVTLYNPGAIGARYVASSLRAAGHDVWLLHLKDGKVGFIPSDQEERLQAIERDTRLSYIRVRRPGVWLYAPYPAEITAAEQDLFISELRRLKPDVAAFSFYTVTVAAAEELTARIRRDLPGLPVMWAGLHAILDSEGCIRHADLICVGEGEEAMVELMNRWEEYRRGGARDVPSFWFRKGDEVVRNPRRPLLKDLDRLPFPLYGEQEKLIEGGRVFDALPEESQGGEYHRLILTGRGCPYHCSYCVHSILREDRMFTQLRRRSVANVMEECERLFQRYHAPHFVFHDEIFVLQKEWIREFAREFKSRFAPRGVTFTGYAHPLMTDEEMLDWMWDAGMRRVGIGVQTGSPRVAREVFERPFYPEKTIQFTRLLAKYPFDMVQFELLTYNPFETEEDRRETFEFLLQLERPFAVECFDLVLYPTSKLGRQTPPVDKLDMDAMIWWTMLYHLTGIPEMDRGVLREIAANDTYRQRPKELEHLATAIARLNAERDRLSREARNRQAAAPAMAPGARGLRRRIERLVENIIP